MYKKCFCQIFVDSGHSLALPFKFDFIINNKPAPDLTEKIGPTEYDISLDLID